MQTITTTDLRTKTKKLVKVLNEGKSVDLIHRSRVVGEIKPKTIGVIFDFKKMREIVYKLNLEPLDDNEIERRYRQAMEEKHGKSIS